MILCILSFTTGAALTAAILTLRHSRRALQEANNRLQEAKENLRVFQENRERLIGKDQP